MRFINTKGGCKGDLLSVLLTLPRSLFMIEHDAPLINPSNLLLLAWPVCREQPSAILAPAVSL